jgi:hypothetical protein
MRPTFLSRYSAFLRTPPAAPGCRIGNMLRGFLLLAVTASVCLAQSGANQGFVNQHLIQGLHLVQPLQPQPPAPLHNESKLLVLPKAEARLHAPCIRIPRQERLPVNAQIDRGIAAPIPAPDIDRQMVIPPPPACPEP